MYVVFRFLGNLSSCCFIRCIYWGSIYIFVGICACQSIPFMLVALKACSHGAAAIATVNIFSELMGCIGFSVTVTIIQCEHLHWIIYNTFVLIKNRSRNHTMWTAFLYMSKKWVPNTDKRELIRRCEGTDNSVHMERQASATATLSAMFDVMYGNQCSNHPNTLDRYKTRLRRILVKSVNCAKIPDFCHNRCRAMRTILLEFFSFEVSSNLSN